MAYKGKIKPEELGTNNAQGGLYLNDLKGITELKFRPIGDWTSGYQYFQDYQKEDGTIGQRPVRSEDYPDTLENPAKKYKSEERVSSATQFIVTPIYDYADEKIKLFQTTKKDLIRGLTEVELDDDLGEITDYDWKAKKTGQGLETKYSVVRLDKTSTDAKITEAYENAQVDLSAYMAGTGGIGGGKKDEDVDPESIPF